jgi:hypothetical protein
MKFLPHLNPRPETGSQARDAVFQNRIDALGLVLHSRDGLWVQTSIPDDDAQVLSLHWRLFAGSNTKSTRDFSDGQRLFSWLGRVYFAGQSSDDFPFLKRLVFGVEIRLHGLARVFSGDQCLKGGCQMVDRFEEVLGGGTWG